MKMFIVFFLLSGMAVGQTRSDYFIIANPLNYTVYDRYEQPLSDADKARFPPFTPFRVLEQNVTLGDQITHACKCGFGQETYFLIQEEGGGFAGEKSKTGRQVLTSCETIEDTVEVIGSGLQITAPSGRAAAVQNGSRLNRIFKSGGRYYVASLSDRAFYGWSRLEPRSSWKKEEKAQASRPSGDTLISDNIRERVMQRLDEANNSYKAAFSHFNKITGDEKAIPQWRCETAGACMRCELAGVYKTGDQLAESTAILLRDLENTLLGTDFRPVKRDNAIVIERRPVEK